jgi:hypothetical protein
MSLLWCGERGSALQVRKLRETVEALWSLPSRQPIEIAIYPSDIAVRARGDIDYDLSLWHRSIFAEATRAAKGNCRNQMG